MPRTQPSVSPAELLARLDRLPDAPVTEPVVGPITDQRLAEIRSRMKQEADGLTYRLPLRHVDALALLAEIDRLASALARVTAQHFPEGGVYADAPVVCGNRYCNDDATDQFAWPCPTMRAVNGQED